jgi:urease accessory protein
MRRAPEDLHVPLGAPALSCRSDAASAAVLTRIRSRGELRLGFRQTTGGTMIADSYQAGCLKLRVPRHPPGSPPEAVLLNTSGGLCEGDRLLQQVRWGDGTDAIVTTLAAEKIYRSRGGDARIDTTLDVGSRACAEWLPQETILFDKARLARDTRVTLADDAAFVGLEAVVLGRTAMGELMLEGSISDNWRIWRGGRLIFADALRLSGQVDLAMQRAAVGAGARAMAMLVHVSERAASLLGGVREALAGALGVAAASAWNGMLVTRLLAPNGAILRHDLLRALAALRGSRPLPRVWGC